MSQTQQTRGVRSRPGGSEGGVRATVRASWERSRRSGLHPDRTLPPVVTDEDDVGELRRPHPLASVWPLLSETLRPATSEPGNLVFVSDSDGQVLWAEGERATKGAAERLHLMPGTVWREDTAGTNGIGMALALRRPFQVSGAEHYLSSIAGYTCIAVPIRYPDTGELVGVLDLTVNARERASVGRSLAMTASRLAEVRLKENRLQDEARLRQRYADRLTRRLGTRSALVTADGSVLESEPAGWLPRRLPAPREEGVRTLADGQVVLVERLVAGGPYLVLSHPGLVDEQADGAGHTARCGIEALGRERALLRIDGVVHELSRRHGEIILALLANPGGLGAEVLTSEVYGAEGKPITLRAELARLRPILGHRLASQPYRLTEPFETDFGVLEERLRAGAIGAALAGYLGPLLPGSQAPAVVGLRDRLHDQLRTAVLDSGDADLTGRWFTAPYGRVDAS